LALTPGTRFGAYEILSGIGAGGMGEVYRAKDTKLNREVAIKVLPDLFAVDPERLARFTREAQTLASLNHPNIAIIHGLEQAGEVHALVMELVPGEDLSERIARGAIPVDEALPIAKQIAEALEAAHEQAIIHRDLKPANIKLRPDGTVKVLDFGLAKIAEPVAAVVSNITQSPTITTPAMTAAGIILGTAAYMSPEQAKGKPADKRSDVWAFGCVLYEMLAGKRAFEGEDVSDTLANVLKREPDWNALPTAVSGSVRTLLRRCLTKDRKRRLDSAADARLEIDDALTAPAPDARAVAGVPSVGWRRLAAVTMAALVVGGVAAGATVWFAMRPASGRVIRTAIPTAGATALSVGNNGPHLTLTPDGSRVVYRGAGQILVRALDQLEPRALTGLGAPQSPFTAPDGQWLGFFDGQSLNKVTITGGPPVPVAQVDGLFRGATWGTDGTIVFATSASTGLQRVSSAGGEVTVLTTPDLARGEADHLWPEFLPDGHAVLFTITAANGGLAAAQIAVWDLRTGTETVLLRGGSHARYLPTGHLVYGAGGSLWAVRFDLRRLAVVGAPVPVLTSVAMTVAGGVEAAFASNGTLAYLSGITLAALTQRTLVWVDRQGREEPLAAPPRAYLQPRLSPDGTRVAVSSADEEQDLLVWDLSRATLTRLTFDPGLDQAPLWTSDSQRLLFSSARAGPGQMLYVQPADGTGSATRLIESGNPQFATSISPDGTHVLVYETTQTRGRDLRLLTLGPTPRVESLLETQFDERGGVISPDGSWLAYESNSSGRYEIYVRPFPAVGDGLWQVSTAGGVQPLWAPRGRELFYVAPDGALMGVSGEVRGASWSSGGPARLLEGRYFTGGGSVIRQYDVTADGQRFLMIKDRSANADSSPQIIVVQNWLEELKRLVTTK
jgi:eukaryotic-like serine/threonine-protein kinase